MWTTAKQAAAAEASKGTWMAGSGGFKDGGVPTPPDELKVIWKK